MKIQYFTYFLDPIQQISLFPNDSLDKNEALKKVLKEPLNYKARNTNLVYRVCHPGDNILMAELGRKSSIKRSLPEDDGFKDVPEDSYPYCRLFVNFSTHPDSGQRIGFEYKRTVFQNPSIQLENFAREINVKLFEYGYAITINPMFDEFEFWSLVEKNQGSIEKLTFNFAIPNLFNLQNELNDDLREVGEKYSATNASMEFENQAGNLQLPKDDLLLMQSAEYASKGGAGFKLKLKGKKATISGGKSVKTKTFTDLDMELESEDPNTFIKSLRTIFQ